MLYKTLPMIWMFPNQFFSIKRGFPIVGSLVNQYFLPDQSNSFLTLQSVGFWKERIDGFLFLYRWKTTHLKVKGNSNP